MRGDIPAITGDAGRTRLREGGTTPNPMKPFDRLEVAYLGLTQVAAPDMETIRIFHRRCLKGVTQKGVQ